MVFPAARWQAAGIDTSALADLDVRIADLGGTTLGLAWGSTIWLDDNAAGWGWFVDPTPGHEAEFSTPGHDGEQNHTGLPSALEHESGHLLGYEHEQDGVTQQPLSLGERLTLHGVASNESWWFAGLLDPMKRRDLPGRRL